MNSFAGTTAVLEGALWDGGCHQPKTVWHARKDNPNDGRIPLHFSPHEIAAAKEQMRQLGIGTLGDYLRWVLRGTLQSKPPAPRTRLAQDD